MNQDQVREMLTLLRSIERWITRVYDSVERLHSDPTHPLPPPLRDQQPVKVWVGDDGKIYAQELA